MVDSNNNGYLNIIKAILFTMFLLIVLKCIFVYCSVDDDVNTREVFGHFYDLPKQTLDVALIGGSGIREYYIAPEGYNHSGVASYALSVGGLPFESTKYYIEEIEKTQSPKVYVVDIRMLAYEGYSDAAIRRATDAMKHSLNRIRLINALKSEGAVSDARIDVNNIVYYLKFPLYHEQWENLVTRHDKSNSKEYMGFTVYREVEAFDPIDSSILDKEPVEISEHNEKVLQDFLDYCDTLEASVLFVDVPSVYDEDTFAKFNYIRDAIEKRGYDVLETNAYIDNIGIDYSVDFRNYYHVNINGAVKFTDYLSEYVKDKYGLIDRRGDERFIQWKKSYDVFESELVLYD